MVRNRNSIPRSILVLLPFYLVALIGYGVSLYGLSSLIADDAPSGGIAGILVLFILLLLLGSLLCIGFSISYALRGYRSTAFLLAIIPTVPVFLMILQIFLSNLGYQHQQKANKIAEATEREVIELTYKGPFSKYSNLLQEKKEPMSANVIITNASISNDSFCLAYSIKLHYAKVVTKVMVHDCFGTDHVLVDKTEDTSASYDDNDRAEMIKLPFEPRFINQIKIHIQAVPN